MRQEAPPISTIGDFANIKKGPLLFYIRNNSRSFGLGIFFLIVTNALDGYYPIIIKNAIDLISIRAPIAEITKVAVILFTLMCSLALTRYLWRVNFGRYHTDAAEDLRNRLFTHLSSMGPNFFKSNPVGELLSVLINDVQSFRNGIGGGILTLFDGVIMIAVNLPLMMWLNFNWTWKTLILLPLVPFLIKKITQLIFATYKIQQDHLAALSGVSQEIVAGIRVIKSFAQEKNRLGMYNESSAIYEDSCNKTAFWDALFGPVMEFGVASGCVILLFIASGDVLAGTATVGTLVAFYRYIKRMTWPMTALGLGFSQYQKGMASFSRIQFLMDQRTDIADEGKVLLPSFESLEVRNLNYQFADGSSPVLTNLNFKIQAGQLVGIVGPVGSGKTTLLHLLARLYPARSGEILVNGTSIEQISQENLRKILTMVPQEAFLFSDTIADNMSFGRSGPIDDLELLKWATSVDLADEVRTLPGGFRAQLGERGVNLSGGQKQRLTIARALMAETEVILLDDSLSAVDTKTEQNIKAALATMATRKKTRVIVAHRISSIENADQIIVLNHGQIEAIGTHAELMQTSSTYQKMARGQIHAKEAAEV